MSIFGKKSKSADDIQKIVDLVHQYNGVGYAVKKMEEFKDQAVALLSHFPDTDAKKSLVMLAEYVVNRDK